MINVQTLPAAVIPAAASVAAATRIPRPGTILGRQAPRERDVRDSYRDSRRAGRSWESARSAAPPAPYAIPSRLYLDYRSPVGVAPTLSLESVRDELRRLRLDTEPEDLAFQLHAYHLDWSGHESLPTGRIAVHRIRSRGGERSLGEPMEITRHALSQMINANTNTPSRFLGSLEYLANTGRAGRQTATHATALALHTDGSDRAVNVRTIRVTDPADGIRRRVIRAVVGGETFGVYDALEFVQDLLDCPDVAGLPVVALRVDDRRFSCRLLLDTDGRVETGRPVRALEIQNSPTGGASAALAAGIFTLTCSNGLYTWERAGRWAWPHRGDMSRVRAQVPQALESIRLWSDGVIADYTDALSVSVENLNEWMEAALLGLGVSQERRQAIRANVGRRTLADHGSLASIVDAVTLTAQAIPGVTGSATLEAVGGRLLRSALSRARAGHTLRGVRN